VLESSSEFYIYVRRCFLRVSRNSHKCREAASKGEMSLAVLVCWMRVQRLHYLSQTDTIKA
jgi:hypothetical protein